MFTIQSYLPIALFIMVGLAIGIIPMMLGKALSRNKPYASKNSAYECGFEEFEDARMQFDVRYYLIAILFILFDLETAFLFPWGVALQDIGFAGYFAMIVFLLEFLLGFIYVWRKGALNWE
jgi:NADH-quinone oxidoreductase subunit A